jgi:hypothetical protein
MTISTSALTSSNDFIQAIEEAREFTTHDTLVKGDRLVHVESYYKTYTWEELAQKTENTSVLYQVDDDTIYCVTTIEDSIIKRNAMCSTPYSTSLFAVGVCSAFIVNPVLALWLTAPLASGAVGLAIGDESDCESLTDDFNYHTNKLN